MDKYDGGSGVKKFLMMVMVVVVCVCACVCVCVCVCVCASCFALFGFVTSTATLTLSQIRDATEELVYSLVPGSISLSEMEKLDANEEPYPEMSEELQDRLNTIYVHICRLLGAARSCSVKDHRYPRVRGICSPHVVC